MRFALAALAFFASAAFADAQTLDGAARTVSAFVAIKSACSKIMPIDQGQATRLAAGIITHSKELYGNSAFSRAMADDIERRRGEVAATGPEQWCAYQRGYFKSIGITGVFAD